MRLHRKIVGSASSEVGLGAEDSPMAPGPPVALLDWDGTVRDGWTLPGWMNALRDDSGNSDLAAQFESRSRRYRAGKLTHDELVDEAEKLYLEALANHTPTSIADAAAEFLRRDRRNIRRFAAHLIDQLQRRGVEIIVISGAPSIVLDHYRNDLSISKVAGMEVVWEDRVWKPRINPGLSHVKAACVEDMCRGRRVIASFGDSASDRPLFDIAEVPVVVGSDFTSQRVDALRLDSDGSGYQQVVARLLDVLAGPA